MIAGIEHLRVIRTSENTVWRMGGSDLERQIKQDIANGFTPLFVCATVGTTSSAAVDPVGEIGSIGQRYGLWVHVDAAYAGAALACTENRYLVKGLVGGMQRLSAPARGIRHWSRATTASICRTCATRST